MISFSADIDGQSDSSGEYTGASLSLPSLPRDFSLCAAFMVEAWTTAYTAAYLFQLNDNSGSKWASITINAKPTTTEFGVNLGKVSFEAYSVHLLFPLTWTRVCVSLDTASGRVVLAVDGRVLEEKIFEEAREKDDRRPANLSILLGYSGPFEDTGMVSQLNMFSSALSTARMVALTQAGGEECGAPGDYVSWEESEWKLSSKATVEMVGELEGPCRRVAEVTAFTADFERSKKCMDHCEKLGQGRSPPVRTLAEWEWLKREVRAITPDISQLPWLWLAATDKQVEG